MVRTSIYLLEGHCAVRYSIQKAVDKSRLCRAPPQSAMKAIEPEQKFSLWFDQVTPISLYLVLGSRLIP